MTRGADSRDESTRADLLLLIEEQPGLSIKEIAHELNLSRSATVYHIRRLGDRIATVRQGHYLLHFASSMPELQRRAMALLRIWSVRHLVEKAIRAEIIEPASLADERGISGRSVRRSIRMLVDAGLAQEQPDESARSARRLLLHPHTRIAWSVWCRNVEQNHVLNPLHKSPGWILFLDMALGRMFQNLSTS